MAISKNSIRIQFTLNKDKKMEKAISDYLETCIDENSKIKEILYSYIVSNCGAKSPQVTNFKAAQSEEKLPKVRESEEKSHEMSQLELNEIDELSKFL